MFIVLPVKSASRATPTAFSKARRRWVELTCGLLILLGGPVVTLGAEFAVTKEYQVKAAFLYNFTEFIDWPAASFAAAGSPIVVGVFCPAAFVAELEATVIDRKVNGRAIAVKKLESAEQAGEVHLLFVCSTDDARLPVLMQALAARPVATVGESEAFARTGGVINFLLDEDKVRFEINIQRAERAGLKISAQLQKLATTVRRTP